MQAQQITEKNYRKLTIEAGLHGFAFAVTDTLNNTVLSVNEVQFSDNAQTSGVEDLYWKAFVNNRELTKQYDEVVVLHANNLNTFVPVELYDDEFMASYLQYNTKVFSSDYIVADALEQHGLYNVYIPYVNINNFLIDQFGQFDFRHSHSVLIPALITQSRNVQDKLVFAHFNSTYFAIVVVQNGKLILANSFEYSCAADVVYYLLFTAEQLKLNPDQFRLQLSGHIDRDSETFKLIYKYVRNTDLLTPEFRITAGGLSETQYLKHFILFQS